MRYCIDIDGTICSQEVDYNKAKPYRWRIKKVNKLYDEGHYIIYHTARGTKTKIDWLQITKAQLNLWGCKFHKLVMGKIEADVFVDDKSIEPEKFFGRGIK